MNTATDNAEITAFIEYLRPNLKKAVSLSDVVGIDFQPDTGEKLYTQKAIVTFHLPEFIRTANGDRELMLVFDFDKLTENARQ